MSAGEKLLEQALPAVAGSPEEVAAAPRPGRLALDLAAIRVLVGRDLKRFFRQRSRVVGALAQPLLFWLLIGSGLERSFRVQGAEQVGYLQYFFPGIVVLVVLFTAIFTTMSVIEDRHEGFLQAVLVAPASRTAIVLGKTLGGVAIALAQAAAVMALAPWAGFPLGAVDWPLAAAMLCGSAVGLSALGFALAWWIDSTQGYHAIMFVLLIPLWVLSGAMFPPGGAAPWMGAAMRWNPMAWCVAGVRRALAGGPLPDAMGIPGATATTELLVVLGFALAATTAAAWVIRRPGRSR
jgi:daunorubicin resistance ABC transporter membrane protein